MQITLDTKTATPDEVCALVDLLHTLFPHVNKLQEPQTLRSSVPQLAPVDHPDAGTLVPPAPPIVTPQPQPQPGAVQRDARGLPWDERIHSSNHKLTDKGVWVMRKGMGNQGAFVAKVEAELLSQMPTTATQVATSGPVFPPAPAVAPPVTLPTPPVVPITPTALPAMPPVAPSLPPAPIVPVVASQAAPQTFAELTMALQPLMMAGKINPDVFNMHCMQAGIPGMAGLASANPQQIAAVWSTLSKL